MPENSLAAFALAVEQGADGIELDVQFSADRKLVIFHDSNLERLTGIRQRVSATPLAELQQLDLGEGQTVPTLDELLEMLGPATLYNIELKDYGLFDRGLEEAVADRLESFNLSHLVLISSFNPLAVRRAQRVFSPSTPVALLRLPGLWRYSYLLARTAFDNPHHALVDEAYRVWARKRDLQTFVWTVDDPVEARRLTALGVQGIITNKPRFLREQLG